MNSAKINFTPRAQQVINVATEKARAENRSEASPSDIAFGLIALGAGVAFNILEKSKINVEILAQTMATNPDAESYKVLIPEASNEPIACHTATSEPNTSFWRSSIIQRMLSLSHYPAAVPIQPPSAARSSRNSTRISIHLPEPVPIYQGGT